MSRQRSLDDLLGPEKVVAFPKRIAIARGVASNLGRVEKKEMIGWDEFCAELSDPLVDKAHSHEAFLSLDKATRDTLKAKAGWIVAGEVEGGRRKQDTVISRSLIAIDIDAANTTLLHAIEDGEFDLQFFAHETRHSTKKTRRLRIYGLTAAPIQAGDYRREALAFARIFVPDLDGVDPGSFEPERLMYLPTVSRDQDYWCWQNEGTPYCPKAAKPDEKDDDGRDGATSLSLEAHNARKVFETFEDLAACVNAIENDSPERGSWYNVLASIAFETDCSDEGRELALSFSERWIGGNHDPDHFEETWAHIAKNQTANAKDRLLLTGAYLLKLAIEDGYRPPICGEYALDEEGVCRAFEDAHRDQLRFDGDRGFWCVLRDGVWRPKGNTYAYHWARLASVDIAKSAEGSKAAKDLRKARTWGAVESAERRNPAFVVQSDYWDPDPYALGTPAGVVDLRTGILRDAVAEDRITRLTAVAPIPLTEFDAERDCPLWLDCLDDWCDRDEGLIRLLQQYAGYALTGDVSEHKLVFIFGAGRNGKGTLQNQLRLIMGNYAVVANMATFAESKWDRHLTELAALAGARLVVASETEEGRSWAEARLKACTGGDPITARFMRMDEFTYEPQFKLLFIGNHKPNLHNVDDAIKARVNIVPFAFRPEKVDRRLNDKLRREWPAILSWMIKGCLDWQGNGLIIPKVVRDTNAEYFRDQDTLGRWIEECCDKGRQFAATNSDLFESYAAFAGLRGESALNKNKSFPDEMKKRGFEQAKDTAGIRGRGFRGVRLKNVCGDEFDE